MPLLGSRGSWVLGVQWRAPKACPLEGLPPVTPHCQTPWSSSRLVSQLVQGPRKVLRPLRDETDFPYVIVRTSDGETRGSAPSQLRTEWV